MLLDEIGPKLGREHEFSLSFFVFVLLPGFAGHDSLARRISSSPMKSGEYLCRLFAEVRATKSANGSPLLLLAARTELTLCLLVSSAASTRPCNRRFAPTLFPLLRKRQHMLIL